MQNKFWDAAKKLLFIGHRDFMKYIGSALEDDEDGREAFYLTLFNKMHLDLQTIKSSTFPLAE